MSDKPKRPWYSPRSSVIVWVLVILFAILVFDIVRDFYFVDDFPQQPIP